MGCLVVLLAFFSPRLALFFLWLFGSLLDRAFDSWYVPLLGFFLLPWTTLAYAVMWNSGHKVEGFDWFIVVLAFLVDISAYTQGERFNRRRSASY
jgi:CDP-diglyceride synthetase